MIDCIKSLNFLSMNNRLKSSYFKFEKEINNCKGHVPLTNNTVAAAIMINSSATLSSALMPK